MRSPVEWVVASVPISGMAGKAPPWSPALTLSVLGPRGAALVSGSLHQPAAHRQLLNGEPTQESRHEAPGLARQHSAARIGGHRRQHP